MFVFFPRVVLSPDVVLEVLSMNQDLLAAREIAVEKIICGVSRVTFSSKPQGRCSMMLFHMVYELWC